MKQEIKQAFNEQGYSFLLPIQEKAIPQILSRKNLFIQAATGSGKTLAYLLPALEIANSASNDTQILIITPTRELALQVSEVAKNTANYSKHHIVTVIGGLDIHKQENALRHRPTIIIGTPGRLMDLYSQKKIDLSHLLLCVVDEVDMVISTGQRKETEYLLQHTDTQLVCTSATKNDLITSFFPEEYEEIIQDDSHVNKNIDTYYIKTEDRKHSLLRLLNSAPIEQSIIFVNYKNDANELADWLKKKDILVSSMSLS